MKEKPLLTEVFEGAARFVWVESRSMRNNATHRASLNRARAKARCRCRRPRRIGLIEVAVSRYCIYMVTYRDLIQCDESG